MSYSFKSKTYFFLGIQELSINENTEGEPLQFRLPNLAIVDFSGTSVTDHGLSLFVACHPKLISLEHKESFHSFKLKMTEHSDSKIMLKKLSSIDVAIIPDEFEFAIEHCPALDSISITSAGLTNENLYMLMNIKYLTNLHLGNKYCQSFNFYEGVAPVLDASGKNLKKLVLEDFTEIDIDFIGNKCPSLNHLAISGTLTYAPISQMNSSYFTKLENLELWNQFGQEHEWCISTNMIKQLLFRAPLKYLLLQRVGNLNDDLFSKILQYNPLLTLKNVVVDYCHNISSRFLWQLLEQPNMLSILRCWHCKGISSKEESEQITQTIKEENLQLYWEWYPYNEYEELLNAGQINLDDDDDEEDEEETVE